MHDIGNYRPISLTCVPRRVYERLLLRRISPVTESILSLAQGGFRPGRGTLHQCYVLHEVMQAHPNAVHAFLDIKAAYDCVNRRILWQDMHSSGFDNHVIRVCQSLFDHNASVLLVNSVKSEPIRCRRGLLQGSSLSPLLFNVYINSLMTRLESLPTMRTRTLMSNHLFFADDGALHANSIEDMRLLLDGCTEWAVEYGMEFSAPKSAILCKNTIPENEQLLIQGGCIPQVDSFTYLGVECRHNGLTFENTRERCAQLQLTASFLKSKGMNALGWRTNCRVLAYKTFLRPKMEYGLALMQPKKHASLIKHMEVTQNNVLNMMLSSDRATSRGAKMKVLALESMRFRQEVLQFSFFNKLNNVDSNHSMAAQVWRLQGRGKPSRMKRAVMANPAMNFKVNHSWNDTIEFILTRRWDSTCEWDQPKVGWANTAASITKPTATKTIYTDPKINRDDQQLLISWRIGSFTFHQPCQVCGEEVTRSHALSCTQVEDDLRTRFPALAVKWNEEQRANEPRMSGKVLFNDFLANTMDQLYRFRRKRERGLATEILSALAQAAKRIRNEVSGYIPTEDGRSFFHPLKKPRARPYRVYPQNQNIVERNRRLAAMNPRPIGRPRKRDFNPP